MVTPVALNGAGCADAVPAISVEANNKATNIFVFTDASLLSWISRCLAMREHHQPVPNLSRASRAKNGEDASFAAKCERFTGTCKQPIVLRRDSTSMKGYNVRRGGR